MSEQDKFKRVIEAIRKTASRILPAGSRVALYGSRARGDARPDSDWDLHILVPGDKKSGWDDWEAYSWPFTELGMEFDEEINPRLYSMSEWLKRSFLPFYKNVEEEKFIIYKS